MWPCVSLALNTKGVVIGCSQNEKGNIFLCIWGLGAWVADVLGLRVEKSCGKGAQDGGIDGENIGGQR